LIVNINKNRNMLKNLYMDMDVNVYMDVDIDK
jgi:hypothetical protein